MIQNNYYIDCHNPSVFLKYFHLNVFDLEVSNGRREALAVAVNDVRGENGGRPHVVREHVHQQINVAKLGGQGTAHDVVRARHALPS